MAATPNYVIRGGPEGRERLRMLSRVMWPTTRALFAHVGVEPDARCLDVGCGGGDVSVALAALVPNGSVVGVDLDDEKLEIARGEAAAAGVRNVEYRVEDVLHPPASKEHFDLVYARFLLTHLPDPAAALHGITNRLTPGGVVIVEDIDFTGNFCHPHSDAFSRYVDLYTRAVQARGCDPNIGPRLPGLLSGAGLDAVGMNVVQPAGRTGEVKLLSPVTLEAIADAVLAEELVTVDELHRTVDDLYAVAEDETTVMSVPRIVQAWGSAIGR